MSAAVRTFEHATTSCSRIEGGWCRRVNYKGVNRGFDIDIAKAISKELFGNEEAVQFVPVTSGDRIAFLISKKIDVIVATLTITEERKTENFM